MAFIVAIIIFIYQNKGYYDAIIASTFFLIFAPYNIFLDIGGGLPKLYVHRIIIILMLWFWIKNTSLSKKIISIPSIKPFLLVIFTAIISTTFSLVFIASFKNLLSVIIEEFIFYIIMITSLSSLKLEKKMGIQMKLIHAVIISLICVALLGVIERFTGFNFATYFPSHVVLPRFVEANFYVYKGRITSTYPHPILLGYGLTMGWPLLLALMCVGDYKRARGYLGLGFLVLGSGIYFTESRGPWLGSILAGMVILGFGTIEIKRKVLFAGIILIGVLIGRPQITNTIMNLWAVSRDVRTLRGSSLNYRLELWGKAYSEISKEPMRLFFGYGDLSHEYVNWSGYEKKTGRLSYFWSWDSEYAAILLDRGFVGSIAFAWLYLSVLLKMASRCVNSVAVKRDTMSALLAGTFVYIFMMTNVKVFSPQVIFLFWITVSIGMTLDSELDRIKVEDECGREGNSAGGSLSWEVLG